MNGIHPPAIARAKVQLPRRTARLRLTLLYSLLFLVAGAALLTITYLLVRSAGDGYHAPSGPPSGLGWKAVALNHRAAAAHTRELHDLLTRSGVALALMALLSFLLGWVVAGHVLHPLRAMTNTTQRITEQNLHQRLAFTGPNDEIKDLADTIDGLLQRLEVAFEAERRFVANASHELRTPLALNRALLDVTLANPHATVEDLRAMGQDLIDSGEHQRQLIEALLTLATSARGLESREPFDLAEIAADLIASPHPEIDQFNLTIQTTLTPAPAIGDPRLATHLVANLLDNALRHNLVGGYIDIATRTESDSAIIAVSNSGPIIPHDDIDRLFQPFQRLHNRTHHTDGHGLGLSIIQSITAAHNATLTTGSQPEGGLHIKVQFPPKGAPGSQHNADYLSARHQPLTGFRGSAIGHIGTPRAREISQRRDPGLGPPGDSALINSGRAWSGSRTRTTGATESATPSSPSRV